MAEETGIAWTDSTFNPWRGCMKVSEGCKNCYAEQLVTKRQGLQVWGQDARRIVAAESTWKNPVRWNKQAGMYPDRCTKCGQRLCMAAQIKIGNSVCPSQRDAAGNFDPSVPRCGGTVEIDVKPKVFCASLADIFERYEGPAMDAVWAARARLFVLVKDTPRLIWQLLTKRPENIMDMVPQSWRESWPRNVWIGCTVENQARANERLPHLLRVPAAVRFVSYEPALGPVEFTKILLKKADPAAAARGKPNVTMDALRGWHGGADEGRSRIDWLIVGGESGPGARPFDLAWACSAVQQCQDAGVAVFVKQLGTNPQTHGVSLGRVPGKGGDLACMPQDLRVREFPQ